MECYFMSTFLIFRREIGLVLITAFFVVGCGKSVPSHYSKPDPKDDQRCMARIEKAVQAGEDLNQLKDEQGWTLLSQACADGNIRSLQLLIDNGVDLKSKEGLLAMDRCFANERLESAKVLIQNGILIGQEENHSKILSQAVFLSKQFDCEFVSLLIGAGIKDLNGNTKDCLTALQTAAWHRKFNAAEILLLYGADVNARDTLYQRTALHFCARKGVPDIAELLIQNGADVNAKDEGGNTPLSTALSPADPDRESASGKRKVAKILQKHGATK